jgi:hypothetical protein
MSKFNKILQILNEIQQKYQLNNNQLAIMQLLKLILIISFTGHLLACGAKLITTLEYAED